MQLRIYTKTVIKKKIYI